MPTVKQLFKVETRGCGDFYVIGASFDDASSIVSDELDTREIGFRSDRKVTRVEFLARQEFIPGGMRALEGDGDDNHLIIPGDMDQDELMQRYEARIADLENKIEYLKADLVNRASGQSDVDDKKESL